MRALKSIPPKTILIFILFASAVLAVFIVSDYSMAFDDNHKIRLAKLSLEAYSPSSFQAPPRFIDLGVGRYYGPAYNMFSQQASQTLQSIWPHLSTTDVYQYTQFLSFLLAAYCIFLISQRLMSDWPALVTSLLFLTQPLLVGHAFINPKDTPFLAFFTASIAAGLSIVDKVKSAESPPFQPSLALDDLKAHWKPLQTMKKAILVSLAVLLLAVLLGAWVFNSLLDNLVAGTVASLYHAAETTFWGSLFQQFAQGANQLPVEDYVLKGTLLFHRVLTWLSIGLFITLVYTISRFLPEFSGRVQRGYLAPLFSEFHPRRILNALKQGGVLLAGLVLGLASAMRIIGPAAGGLVALYAFGKFKKKSISILVAYFSIAAVVMFLTWPFLWANPVKNYLEAWSVFADFPWVGNVLFNGENYLSTNLPRSYLPTLVAIQLTEPVLILAVVFVGLLLFKKTDDHLDKILLLILSLWFLAPLLYVIVFRPVMYDNFRQFLFLLPPIFIFAGVGLQRLARRIDRTRLNALMFLIVLLPGVINIIQLHPYQYVYYNRFVGGLAGAFRQFELDYWFTGHKEAIQYLNQVAPPHAEIIVTSGKNIIDLYAREDLEIVRFNQITKPITEYDYFIRHTRSNKDLKTDIPGNVVYQVGKQNAVYDWVIKIEPGP